MPGEASKSFLAAVTVVITLFPALLFSHVQMRGPAFINVVNFVMR